MVRRQGSTACAKRYLGTTVKNEVNDLANEQTGVKQCQIEEIIVAEHANPFILDTLERAHSEGYDNCAHYICGSKRLEECVRR